MQQKTDQAHIGDPVEKMQAVPNRPQKVNCWSCSFQLWRRRVEVAHTLIGIQHTWWTVVLLTPSTRTQAPIQERTTMNWRPATSGRQHCILATLPKTFHNFSQSKRISPFL